MTDGFVKIYGSKLISSSLWNEPPEVRLVFIGMLALANRHGVVDVPGVKTLARVLNLTVEYVQAGLAVLEAPDPDSRSPEHDGRRVVPLDTGWLLVNYEAYRELRTDDQEKGRERAARWRANRRAEAEGAERSHNVTPVMNTAEAEIRSQNSEAEESLPAHARDPMRGATGERPPVLRMTGFTLSKLFGEIRAEVIGGFPWVSAKSSDGKISTFADKLSEEEGGDVEGTIRAFFRHVKAGEPDWSDERFSADPTWAFSAWTARFTRLREELHGKTPRADPPRSQPMKPFIPPPKPVPKKASA